MSDYGRRSISSLDIDELSRLGIRCTNFPGAKDNVIVVQDGATSPRGLGINFSGEGNVVDLRGRQLPSGEIGLVGDEAKVSVESDNEVVMQAYVYGRSSISIFRPRAVFGLWISIFEGTSLSIGEGTLIAEGAKIFTSDHHSMIDLDSGLQVNFPGDVAIGGDVWIANDVTILKNVTIGQGSIIGARSLVTGDVPAKELWGGLPARCLRQRVSWVASHPAHPSDIRHLLAALGENG